MSHQFESQITSSSPEKNRRLYHLVTGITPDQVEELLSNTRTDPYFKSHTSDLMVDGREQGRFSSKEKFDHWRLKRGGRQIYSLLDEENKLAGILWFGQEPLNLKDYDPTNLSFDPSLYGLTWGFRIYGDSRGTGLAAPFAKQAHDHFLTSPGYLQSSSPGLWLETDVDNQGTQVTGKKLGYSVVAKSRSGDRLIMIKPPDNVRITT
jgi:hypothetical protein